MSNNNIIAKNSEQVVVSPLPSSGCVRYRDMRHEHILQCSVIVILGHRPVVSFHFPYHWMKGVHSNCAILYTTLFFTYMVDGIKAMIRPGTSGREGLHLLLPLMSADLAGEQELGLRCGNSTCFVQPLHPRTYRSAAGRLTHHQYLRLDARRCMIRQNSLHRRRSRQCIECQQTFTNIILCYYT